MTQPVTKMDFVLAMQREYTEISSIDETIKQLKEDAKEKGFNAAFLAKIAKARAEAKLADLVEKSQELIDLVDELG